MIATIERSAPTVTWAQAITGALRRFPQAAYIAITCLDSSRSPEHVAAIVEQLSGLRGHKNVYPAASILGLDLDDEKLFPGFDEAWLLTAVPEDLPLKQPIVLYNLSEDDIQSKTELADWMTRNNAVAGLDSGFEIITVSLSEQLLT